MTEPGNDIAPQPAPAPRIAWPTPGQLAHLSTTVHWQLEQAAYDLPAGRMTVDAELKLAEVLEQLAAAYRSHAETRPSPAPRRTIEPGPTY